MNYRRLEEKYQGVVMSLMKTIVKKLYIKPSEIECFLSNEIEDMTNGFDMVFSQRIKISVRIRSNYYLSRFNDVTIRFKPKGNGLTEIDKVKDGYGHIYFYAWESVDKTRLDRIVVYDISRIRHLMDNYTGHGYNDDGSELVAYSIEKILKPNNALIVDVYWNYDRINKNGIPEPCWCLNEWNLNYDK